jgi:hypothetical protein
MERHDRYQSAFGAGLDTLNRRAEPMIQTDLQSENASLKAELAKLRGQAA